LAQLRRWGAGESTDEILDESKLTCFDWLMMQFNLFNLSPQKK